MGCIIFLIGLPLLYGIGRCAWLWRRDGLETPVTSPARGVGNRLPTDDRYEAAREAAQDIIVSFARRPDMPEPRRLADVTSAILEAIYCIEERRQTGPFYAEPSVN